MTTEQKAKAYDELLIKAKQIYNKENDVLIIHTIEDLFPELKEPEDERIRKELLKAFQESEDSLYMVLTPHRRESFIAWLEKQGEQKLPIEKLPEEMKTIGESLGFTTQEECDEYNKMVSDIIMSADKVEPKFKVKYAGSEYNVLEVKDIAGVTYYGIEDEPNHIDYVQAENCERISGYSIKENGSPYPTKPAKFSEQKPAELPKGEDYGIDGLYHAIRILEETIGSVDGYQSDDGILEHKCAISAVKKLYEQKPTEWSEEDEYIIEEIEAIIDAYVLEENNPKALIDWLKSLRPQNNITDEELAQAKKNAYNDALDKIEYHSGEPTFDDGWSAAIWYLKKKNAMPQTQWKPSDEQMEALDDAISSRDIKYDVLSELWKDLKKLKG